MSRLRVSNAPGEAGWRNEGEAFARVQGYGGQMVVAASTPGAKNDHWMTAYRPETAEERRRAKQREYKERSREKRREARIHIVGCIKAADHRNDCKLAPVLCDHQLRKYKHLGNCARTKGHVGAHQSRQSLDRENAMRRQWRDGVAA